MTEGIVPQRCVLVLPSTGAFDSRTYRIATTLAEMIAKTIIKIAQTGVH